MMLKNNRIVKLLAIIIISSVGIIIYSNTFHSPFLFDDPRSISDNAAIKDLGSLRNIWGFYPNRFITYLSIALNYHFNNLDVFGYHVFNLIVHLISALLVWWLALLTFATPAMKDKPIAKYVNIISLFAGLIFVAHPIQTQAVTYIIQRAVSMATLFYLASMALYVKARLGDGSSHSRSCYAFSLVFAVMAMFTKEMAITLPFAILFYELSFFSTEKGGTHFFRDGFRKMGVPFFLLPIIPLTMILTKSVDFAHMRRVVEPGPGISPYNYLLTQFKVICTYLRLVFLPFNQNLDYDYTAARTIFDPSVLGSLAVLVIILIAAFKLFRNYRLLSLGIFFFFLTLLPESSIIPIRDVIFEHRLYLPMFGASLFLGSALFYLDKDGVFKVIIVMLSMLLVFFSILTYQRNEIWRNAFTLWDDVVHKSPNKARPHNNRGAAYGERASFDRAISDFAKAIEINPDYAEAYNNRGIVYGVMGDVDLSIADYDKAIEINPKYDEAYNNRGVAYGKRSDVDRAITDYDIAIEINPGYAGAYYNRGNTYRDKGSLDQAIADYAKAVEANPKYASAFYNRGNIYLGLGKFDLAIADYAKAIEAYPRYADAYCNRGIAHERKGNLDLAVADYTKAVEANPRYADAYNNRGVAYEKMGDLGRAIADLTKAVEINPDHASAYYNRGNAYMKAGNFSQAAADYSKAIEINPHHAGMYYNCGNAYMKMGSFDQAAASYSKAIEINPDYAEAYSNRGAAYLYGKDYDNCWRDVHKLEELGYKIGPDFINALKKSSGRER